MTDNKQSIRERVELLEELSPYLFDLANTIHEHREMLFRLSDKAKAEADKLRQQIDLPQSGG